MMIKSLICTIPFTNKVLLRIRRFICVWSTLATPSLSFFMTLSLIFGMNLFLLKLSFSLILCSFFLSFFLPELSFLPFSLFLFSFPSFSSLSFLLFPFSVYQPFAFTPPFPLFLSLSAYSFLFYFHFFHSLLLYKYYLYFYLDYLYLFLSLPSPFASS